MTHLLAQVRKRMPSCCFTKKCRKNRCSVSLRYAPKPHLIIDMDKAPISLSARRCDYIFIEGTSNARVVALELKSGRAEASEVVKQLRGGALFVDCIIPKGAQVSFRPVVASGELSTAQRNELRKSRNQINFRGQSIVAERIRCGRPLTSVL